MASAPRRLVRPTIAVRPALILLAIFVALATLQALAMHTALRAQGARSSVAIEVAGYVSGAIGAWLGLPAVQLAVANAPFGATRWLRPVMVHIAGYLAFTAVHILVMLALRSVAGVVLVGMDARFGDLVRQALYEVEADVVLYPAIVSLWYALGARAAQLRAAQLERDLARARLDALSARLDPHFLFNALHTIGALMHEDLERTDRLLAGFGELLRATLEEGKGLWTLGDERAHTETYLEMQRARFGDRLRVDWSPTQWDGAGSVPVPRFALQSLVENALKHNADREAPLTIEVALAEGDRGVELRVSDDGRGFAGLDPAAGHGLARLEETLALALGDAATLSRGRSSRGGAEVTLRLPREASGATA
ncbi:MAG: sensor histidine kinase [Sandaracinaceae bacterium]